MGPALKMLQYTEGGISKKSGFWYFRKTGTNYYIGESESSLKCTLIDSGYTIHVLMYILKKHNIFRKTF